MGEHGRIIGSKMSNNLWPYVEARKIIERVGDSDKEVIFETGYGPSGLPHIGTFGEVARTMWVKKAYEELSGKTSKLIVFSDDLDGLRKIPENIYNQESMVSYMNFPLSSIPDPYGIFDSYSDHNNNKLIEFLDKFKFDYTFMSQTKYQKEGFFNDGMKLVAEKYNQILDVVLPTLKKENRKKWSPFMPIHPKNGKIYQVEILNLDVDNGLISWKDETDTMWTTSIFDGNCKCQWYVNWALRWYALGVDYEMSGKDLIDSVRLSSKICRILGGTPPINLTYELFLDLEGGKISKSKGNGFTIDEWLEIATSYSLELFMFNNPQRAKKIGKDVAVQMEEDYIKLSNQQFENTKTNGVSDDIISVGTFIVAQQSLIPVGYSTIINLVSAAGCETKEEVWEYLFKYDPTLENTHYIDAMAENAIRYCELFVYPNKQYRVLTDDEKTMVCKLLDVYKNLPKDEYTAERYQYYAFEVGKEFNMNLREWFKLLYEFLLGQSTGPKFGNFVDVYGLYETIKLMESKLQ